MQDPETHAIGIESEHRAPTQTAAFKCRPIKGGGGGRYSQSAKRGISVVASSKTVKIRKTRPIGVHSVHCAMAISAAIS